MKNLEIFIQNLEKQKELGQIEVEVNFANEGVQIKDVPATGKIDKLVLNGNSAVVTDFKTGKSFRDWNDGDSNYDKIKLHFFEYQLAFYALLLRNSRTYERVNFEKGIIEFVEADSKNKVNILEIKDGEEFEVIIDRVESLVNAIYKKILDLDFPDTARYKLKKDRAEEKDEVTLRDIIQFEDDLLSGNI